MSWRLAVLGVVAVTFFACAGSLGSVAAEGTEGGRCYPDQTCNAGLVCNAGNVCVAGATCVDGDGDGFGLGCAAGSDCDDADAAVSTCSDAAILTWTAPTTNADGSPLVDLAGYKVHYGSTSGAYSTHEDVGIPTCRTVSDRTDCTYTVRGFSAGTYYFAVSAYNDAGIDGAASTEGSKSF